MKILRNIKNKIVGNKKIMGAFISLINFPIIGGIYDFFYFKLIRKKVNSGGIELTIEPSNVCNLKCIMCPYQRMKRKKEVMSMELFKNIVDQAIELGCKNILLQQYNEPFLDKFIFERIKYIKEKGIKTILIYSNGTVLNKKIREKILETKPEIIRFSVDGTTKETFESIRIGANFEEVVGNIQKLFGERNKKKQKYPIIEVYFTLLDKNKKEAKDFLKFWKNKCDFASLYPADSRESGLFASVNYKNKKPYPCLNPREILVLSNAKVALCCVDVDGAIPLGDLKKEKLKDIYNSKRLRGIYESQMKRKCEIEMCKKCSKLYIDSAFKWWMD